MVVIDKRFLDFSTFQILGEVVIDKHFSDLGRGRLSIAALKSIGEANHGTFGKVVVIDKTRKWLKPSSIFCSQTSFSIPNQLTNMTTHIQVEETYVEVAVNDGCNTIFKDSLRKVTYVTAGREFDVDENGNEIDEQFMVYIGFDNSDSMEIDCGTSEAMQEIYRGMRDLVHESKRSHVSLI